MDFYGTLGPSCCDRETLRSLFDVGMTGIRLNLSHTSLHDCKEWLENLHAAASDVGISPQLLIDLQGPELRIGELSTPLDLRIGEVVRLGTAGLPIPALLFPALIAGQQILLDDGKLLLRADRCSSDYALCTVLRGGVLHSRKSIAIPGAKLHPPTLTDMDLINLSEAAESGVTGVMLPFVRSTDDLTVLRKALIQHGVPGINIFAKLENHEGVAILSKLLPLADQIVIARGDLGNDFPLWELPAVQKSVAASCRSFGKPFMVVTQMLHSMEHSAVPTRAEVLDIFNAVLDGAASLMLTGETAVGSFPVEAMRYLCRTAEEGIRYLKGFSQN